MSVKKKIKVRKKGRPVERRTEILDADIKVPFSKQISHEVLHRDEPTTTELKNVIADSIERIYQEFGQDLDRVNSEDKALILVRYLKYGITSEGQDKHPGLRQKSYDPPLCKRCKAA